MKRRSMLVPGASGVALAVSVEIKSAANLSLPPSQAVIGR